MAEPKKGKKFNFHGAFASKQAAVAKEKDGAGRFIVEREIHGRLYHIVLSEK